MTPLFVFAHGAGLPSSHPWMEKWAALLGAFGTVVRFDYPYMAAGRKRPDRLEVLIEAHRAAWRGATAKHEGPVVLVGKSMGGRVGCHLALDTPVDALICLGYPLVGMGKRSPVRDAVLRALQVPILFVQGTRDRMCPLDQLATVRDQMNAPSALHVVQTGDHSLQITKTHTRQTGASQADADDEAARAIAAFLSQTLPS